MSDKRSPLHERNEALGGKIVSFAGWLMPVQYTSLMAEHKAVREGVGVFDISHMGQFRVSGDGAGEWLNRMLANNLGKLDNSEGQYTFLLNEAGGVIDDLIIYRENVACYFLVVNASKIDEDWAWLNQHLPSELQMVNQSDQMAGMAIQGPHSPALYEKILPGRSLPLRNGIEVIDHDGEELVVCRTGYTGEDGFEFFCPAGSGGKWLQAIVDAGATPCGLGARDSLRLEMCYPLNGSDLSPERTPLQAGLGFFVDLEKGDFMGRGKLVEQKESGLGERLVALQYLDRGAPPRAGYELYTKEGELISKLTSGVLSPSLMSGIGMAYLPVGGAKLGTQYDLEVRGRKFPMKVVKKPFYKKQS